jgi:hypothetical protein
MGYDDFDMAGWPPGRHRGLPDGGLTMVLSVGAPVVIRRAGHADLTAAATVSGLRSSWPGGRPTSATRRRSTRSGARSPAPRAARR